MSKRRKLHPLEKWRQFRERQPVTAKTAEGGGCLGGLYLLGVIVWYVVRYYFGS